jgi:integrase
VAYRSALKHFLDYVNGPPDETTKTRPEDHLITEITLKTVEGYEAWRRSAGKKEKTIWNELVILVTGFRWAKKRGFIRESPCDNLELPRKPKNPPRYLTTEQYRQLMSAIDDEAFKDVVDFYLLTGIRRSEGPPLRFSLHVDEELGILQLPQQKQRNFKTIPISNNLRPVLSRLKLRSKGGELIPYAGDRLTKLFAAYVAKAGLPDEITFHALRHTFGTWLARAGVNQPLIQTLLGHSDADSTQHYVHAYSEDLLRAMNALVLPTREDRG